MIKLTFDDKGFSRQLRQIGDVTGKSTAAVVTSVARLWLRDCISLTPPSGRGRLATSKALQKKHGLRAIKRDIAVRAFPLLESIIPKKSQTRFQKEIWRLARKGQFDTIAKILRASGYNVAGVIDAPTKDRHNRLRGRYGKVKKGAVPFYVLKTQARNRFVKDAQKRSGRAKAGWSKAAAALRLPYPSWNKSPEPGVFNGIKDRDKPVVVFGNGVRFLRGSYYEKRIMASTLHFRQRAMRSHMMRMMRALKSPEELKKMQARLASQRDNFEALA